MYDVQRCINYSTCQKNTTFKAYRPVPVTNPFDLIQIPFMEQFFHFSVFSVFRLFIPSWLLERKDSEKVIQFSLVAQSCPTLCDPMDCSMPGLPVHHQLPEFTQTHVRWVSDAIQPSHTLSPLLQPSIFPRIRLFSNESVLCIRWPKYWSFSFSIRLGLELRKPEEPVLEFILEKGHDLEGRVQTISVLSWPLWRPPLPITTTSSGHPLSGKWT